jgi:serpin B
MKNTLELSGFGSDDLNLQYKNLIDSLVSVDAGIVLNIANSMWIRESFMPEVKTGFIQTLQTYYSCAPNALDFSSPAAISTINAWIEKQTNGMIKNMMTQIDDGIVMFLINALYFKGEWVNKFDPANTISANFYGTDGSARSVSMMSASNKLKYYDGANFSAARLPYGRDKIAMYIFLPKAGTGVNEYISGLDAVGFETAMAAMESAGNRPVNLKMPKFKFEYGVKSLNDELKALGMSTPLDPQKADFGNIARNVYIQFVDHKAVIDVNEKGSEAAAVTIIGVGTTSFPVDTVDFTVERPFFFVIRDDRSGSILFMGMVTAPAYN